MYLVNNILENQIRAVPLLYIAFMSCKWETGRVVPQGGSGEVIELNDNLKLLLIPGASAAGLADVTVSESRVAALGEITVLTCSPS